MSEVSEMSVEEGQPDSKQGSEFLSGPFLSMQRVLNQSNPEVLIGKLSRSERKLKVDKYLVKKRTRKFSGV